MMELTAAGRGFVVFILWMPVLHCRSSLWGVTYTSTNICALEGSTVVISCSFKYPSDTYNIVRKIWTTEAQHSEPLDLREDPQYSKRVQYHCSDNNCNLTIEDLTSSDSAQYYFRFITDRWDGKYTGKGGVTLSVTGLQTAFFAYLKLQCDSTCQQLDHVSYIWYKNGEKISGEPTADRTHSSDSFSCAVEGHEDFPSPPQCVNYQRCNKVIYDKRRICAVEGSSVLISCQYTSSGTVTSKFWFRHDSRRDWMNSSWPQRITEDQQFAGRVTEHHGQMFYLRINDVRESDSAEYRFTFKTQSFEWRSSLPGVTLTVTDPDLQVKVARTGTSWANLECHSRCFLPKNPSYVWYKNGWKVPEESSAYYSGSFSSTDSVSCALSRHESFPSPPVCVLGQLCNRVICPERRICAAMGSSVDISCFYQSGEAVESKLWFSPDGSRNQWINPKDLSKDSQFANRVTVLETEQGLSTLRIRELRQTDSIQYHFLFRRTSRYTNIRSLSGTSLQVTALQVKVIGATVYPSHTEAELECNSQCHQAAHPEYVWFKNGEKVKNKKRIYEDRFHPGDVVSCALKGHENHASPSLYVLNVPSVSVSPSGEIMENSSVTLTCSSDANQVSKHTWYKRQQQLVSEGPQLVFKSVRSSDSGQYYCTSENEWERRTSTLITIDVQYAPKTIDVSVSFYEVIVQGKPVNLTCSSDANPAANYTWYRNHRRLAHGPEGTYYFPSISSEDTGIYSCESKNKHGTMSSSLSIDVQYAPKPPSVWVSPSGELVEGSSVTLTCSSDANPAASYTWYREGEETPKASKQNFTISNISPEHSGNYSCEAKNGRGRQTFTVNLLVKKSGKAAVVGASTAVILVLIFLIVFVILRKRICKPTREPGARIKITEQHQVDQEQQEEPGELHYASVHFSKHREECLYSNVTPVQRRRATEEQEDTAVLYSAVRHINGSRATSQECAEAVYSTVNNIH